jgi:hypothetical protein
VGVLHRCRHLQLLRLGGQAGEQRRRPLRLRGSGSGGARADGQQRPAEA